MAEKVIDVFPGQKSLYFFFWIMKFKVFGQNITGHALTTFIQQIWGEWNVTPRIRQGSNFFCSCLELNALFVFMT